MILAFRFFSRISFFAYYIYVRTYSSYFALGWKDPGPDSYKELRIRFQEAPKLTGPTDPEPYRESTYSHRLTQSISGKLKKIMKMVSIRTEATLHIYTFISLSSPVLLPEYLQI
jgi:hypothetical protein